MEKHRFGADPVQRCRAAIAGCELPGPSGRPTQLTREHVAQHLGVSLSMVHSLLSGRRTLRRQQLLDIAELTGTDPDWIMLGAPRSPHPRQAR